MLSAICHWLDARDEPFWWGTNSFGGRISIRDSCSKSGVTLSAAELGKLLREQRINLDYMSFPALTGFNMVSAADAKIMIP